jgi:adenosylcobinamide-GDP ribazoletransferase
MNALRVFRGLIAFLTVVPMKMDEDFLKLSGQFMFLFPVIAILIGLLTGLYSFLAHHFLLVIFNYANAMFFFNSQNSLFALLAKAFASVMTLAFVLVLTGLQHTDGLIDVGNALSIGKASMQERTEIARAWIVTRTGAFVALLVYYCTFILIFLLRPQVVIQSFIVAEVSAKLAMVTCAWQGTSPRKGLGSIFIDSMRKRHSLYTFSLVTSLLVSAALLSEKGVFAVASGIVVGGLLIILGRRVFGGVTGDIFGATNEIARTVALLALVI